MENLYDLDNFGQTPIVDTFWLISFSVKIDQIEIYQTNVIILDNPNQWLIT